MFLWGRFVDDTSLFYYWLTLEAVFSSFVVVANWQLHVSVLDFDYVIVLDFDSVIVKMDNRGNRSNRFSNLLFWNLHLSFFLMLLLAIKS